MADLIDRLKQDHDHHREILAKLADANGAVRQNLFDQFKAEATSHANAEEQTLYAEMMADPETQDEARHSVSEHKQIEDYVSTLEGLETSSDDWMATFLKLKHRYEHHIEEEENEFFPKAKDEIEEARRAELGDKFAERKDAELSEAKAA
ncbi:MAG: hemerythrin domain-containing protein [Pacificimonas sp.]